MEPFASVPEQPEAKRLLTGALETGGAHAYLLHGPAGVGKRTAALAPPQVLRKAWKRAMVAPVWPRRRSPRSCWASGGVFGTGGTTWGTSNAIRKPTPGWDNQASFAANLLANP